MLPFSSEKCCAVVEVLEVWKLDSSCFLRCTSIMQCNRWSMQKWRPKLLVFGIQANFGKSVIMICSSVLARWLNPLSYTYILSIMGNLYNSFCDALFFARIGFTSWLLFSFLLPNTLGLFLQITTNFHVWIFQLKT